MRTTATIVLNRRDMERDIEKDASMLAELSVELAEKGCPNYDDPDYVEKILTEAVAGKGAIVLCMDGAFRVIYRGGRIEFTPLDQA